MKLQLEENDSVSFEELTAGANKRTAAACFLEILQLKTWDYVDTIQKSPYAPIAIHSTEKLWRQNTSTDEGDESFNTSYSSMNQSQSRENQEPSVGTRQSHGGRSNRSSRSNSSQMSYNTAHTARSSLVQ